MRSRASVVSFALLVAWALLATAPATAGSHGVELVPVRPELEIYGVAALTHSPRFEAFNVRILASRLQDGSTLMVSITRDDSERLIDVAIAEIILGSALVSLESTETVSPAFPVRGIRSIVVRTLRGNVLLRGEASAVAER
jgi:hypothetical protein